MADRLGENGAIRYAQDRWSFQNNDSRLAGAGQIANDIRKLAEEGKYTDYVSALTVRGRLINRMIDVVYWPRKLFANNEVGTWFDPSDMSTLFQNQAGTTPVTAVEQPVSLMLDKSKGGGAIGTNTVVNGTFDADSDWTKGTGWTIGLGVATKIAGTAAELSQAVTLTAGRYYIVTYTITRTAGTLTMQFTGGTTVSGTARSAAGTFTDILTAVSGNTTLEFSADATFVGTVDNVTLKEMPAGNHAYTPAAASTARPTLSAKYNLFNISTFVSSPGSSWQADSVTVTLAQPDVDLSNTAVLIDEGTATATHQYRTSVGNTFATPANTNFTMKFKVKDVDTQYMAIAVYGAFNTYVTVEFDLTAGTVNRNAAANITLVSSAITDIGDGWQLCEITYNTPDTTAKSFRIGFSDGVASLVSTTGNLPSITGTSRKFYMCHPDCRISNDGTSIPTYQRVTTSTDYDTVNFPPYLRFDGSNDYMLTNSIDFTGTDKMTVFAGVRKLSNATGILCELSTDTFNNNGAFVINPAQGNGQNYAFYGKGTTFAGLTATTFSSPISNVLSVAYDISKANQSVEILPNINGAIPVLSSASGSTGAMGTGNFGNYPIYIGMRAGTGTPFNGRLYSLITRGVQSTESEITNTEQWVNQRTRAY
jgi:hypothetical protein